MLKQSHEEHLSWRGVRERKQHQHCGDCPCCALQISKSPFNKSEGQIKYKLSFYLEHSKVFLQNNENQYKSGVYPPQGTGQEWVTCIHACIRSKCVLLTCIAQQFYFLSKEKEVIQDDLLGNTHTSCKIIFYLKQYFKKCIPGWKKANGRVE